MLLTKGDSSCRKGKEVAADDPLAKTMGEEAPHSKLDHSEEEERVYDPSSQMLSVDKNIFGYTTVT